MRRAMIAIGLLLAGTPLNAQLLTIDPHLDLPRKSAAAPGWTGLNDPTSQFDLDKAKAGGPNAAAIALFVPQGPRDAASLAKAQVALSPADVRRIAAFGRFAVVESLLDAWPRGDGLDQFDHWYGSGVRIVGFVHAGHNQFADSSRPALQFGDQPVEHHGLSPLGKAAVARLNNFGIPIDISQLSDAAFDQTLKLTRAPVIASHSDVRALVDTSRNLSDAARALKANSPERPWQTGHNSS